SIGYTGVPLQMYEPQDLFVELGDEARLFCEAFVGRIDLPDAHNEVNWRRSEHNNSLSLQGRFLERRVPR
ncbi:hypothetical protein L9F63_011618, partial [Diploptera punctata]